MGEVVQLETKCPLCDGKGNVEYWDGFYGATMMTGCSMCRGTGKRPSEEELKKRRSSNSRAGE